MLWGNCYFCDQFRVSNKITINIVMKIIIIIIIIIIVIIIKILLIIMVIIMVMIVLMIICYQFSLFCVCAQEDQGIYHEKVRSMISKDKYRLIVNLNDLRRKNEKRAIE